MNRNNHQPVIQILTKSAFIRFLEQVAMGSGDQPDVYLESLGAANPHNLFLLNHPQQLDLQHQRHITNLIKKQCPVVCQFKQTRLALFPGASKGPALIPEKL